MIRPDDLTDEMVRALRAQFIAEGEPEAARACDSALEAADPCEARWPTAVPVRVLDRRWCCDAINARSAQEKS